MSGWGSETVTKETSPQFKPVKRGRKVTQQEFTNQKRAEDRGEMFKIADVKQVKKEIVKSSVLEGYAAGSIVSIVGGPKAGKSTFSLQEVIQASKEGYDSLYMFNESPKVRFADIIRRRMAQMKVGDMDMANLTFCNVYGEVLGSASYASIDAYMIRFWGGKIRYWIKGVKRPRFIVIDSISKVGRVYVPQLFKMMESFCGGVIDIMDECKKYPVVLLIHQKSGGYWERYDESVVGGAGLIHETDTTINIRKYEVNRKMSVDTGFEWGSRFYTIQVDTRDVDCPQNERMLHFKDGYLKVGSGLEEAMREAATERRTQQKIERPGLWMN